MTVTANGARFGVAAQTTPVHRDATPTEAAAAKRASRWAATLEARVLSAVIEAGDQGLTADEARRALGLAIEKHYSVAPRLSAMRRKGWLQSAGESRDNFGVYVATAAGRAKVGAR